MGLFDFLKSKSLAGDDVKKTIIDPNNDFKSQLDNIQKEIFLFLKPLGFVKQGRTFNRQTEHGIHQVINIQSAKYEFGNKDWIRGIRESYYGKFTINLGVMVKELYELEPHKKAKNIYQDYDCQIRTRLPHLTVKQDFWWPISHDNLKTTTDIIEGLNSQGIQWLNMFKSRKEICENWGIVESSAIRAKLDVALIVLQTNKEKGAELIQDYYNNIGSHNGHKEYVKVLADGLGIKLDSKI